MDDQGEPSPSVVMTKVRFMVGDLDMLHCWLLKLFALHVKVSYADGLFKVG